MKINLLFVLFMIFLAGTMSARPFRVGQMPNGAVNGCANCHMSASGGDERNAFGRLVETRFLTAQGAAGQVKWGPLLASLDADGDGVSNGDELLDPQGTWQSGQQDPGSTSLVSNPGVQSDNKFINALVQFSGMAPHNGQLLELRVIDKTTMKEVYRTKIDAISSADFNIELQNLLSGGSYLIDFYADFNNNKKYDSPPADHSWRLVLNNVQGNDAVQFAHNTNFTEINFGVLINISFTGMGPHAGQLLELRVVNADDNSEAGRIRVENISTADFLITVPGLQPNNNYKVQFYADFNNNGTYDSPPADHAWEIAVSNLTQDTTVGFNHNTNFNDITWNYLYTLNFGNMSPHSGQVLELRIVREDNNTEIGRIRLDSITVSNFSLSVPGIESGTAYRADFYADFNNNSKYDAPPADHAWRLTFNSENSNFVQNFSHNTNFTDIQWPVTTDIDDNLSNPVSFSLGQNYPNPFNPFTHFDIQIPVSGNVLVKVYNSLGQEAATLVNQYKTAGTYKISFDASELKSGIYFYQMTSGNIQLTRKMLLLK